ncbi:MAG: two-component system nitrogen regulation sensor histidine kinase NtrY [Alteromonadaceae bacterium]|jgi:two-component system nitrogen regulation sensor histidine kinase NtrY
MILTSIKGKFIFSTSLATTISSALVYSATGGDDWQYFSLLMLFILSLTVAIALYCYSSVDKNFQSLELGLLNFKDNEFTVSLPVTTNNEFSQLNQLFNEVSTSLRKEKQHIYQRELLLDKVIESSPLAMTLVDDNDHVIYANSSARALLNKGKRFEGGIFSEMKKNWPESLVQAISADKDGLFTIEENDENDETHTWHISRGQFLLNNQYHHLFLFKQLTREISRQEVAVWKKVIRVISHELNNSLAPISSMAHSGQLIANKLNHDKLSLVFSTIKGRVEHLDKFISGYATFAKLPMPIIEKVSWQQVIEKLKQQTPFVVDGDLPNQPAYFDLAQIEQVLINLLKNAGEANSASHHISLAVNLLKDGCQITIADRGTGMSDIVLQNALIPFYSTKQSGTGLGLALCREIIEAHDGQISLNNRHDGGLIVRIFLPKLSGQ